ncbi:uncharacterized protein LOC127060324 [Serinus canaria]|uniref:uncharacterized protein LOC127060324 n=1 Tax=Serinus canaria TaxID=9135 RepID=UPI0021CCFAF1|nr:uncharacterized protein LOC127060324 [Serinus canaria]
METGHGTSLGKSAVKREPTGCFPITASGQSHLNAPMLLLRTGKERRLQVQAFYVAATQPSIEPLSCQQVSFCQEQSSALLWNRKKHLTYPIFAKSFGVGAAKPNRLQNYWPALEGSRSCPWCGVSPQMSPEFPKSRGICPGFRLSPTPGTQREPCTKGPLAPCQECGGSPRSSWEVRTGAVSETEPGQVSVHLEGFGPIH